jgi:hypothetical protein
MRRRLLVCLTFALLGLLVAFPISDHLSVDLTWALAGSAAAGLVLGYFVSIMCDVFFGDAGETETENES